MKRLAFIDHSFHKKTNSTQFMVDLLKEKYQVNLIWDDLWQGGAELNFEKIEKQSYDVIIFFQVMLYPVFLIRKKISCLNIIFIPMYDEVKNYSDLFLKQFARYRLINFSRNLHERVVNIGLRSIYVQYFPEPVFFTKSSLKEPCGFFWQRTGILTWLHIRKLIDNISFRKFYFHKVIDPFSHCLESPEKGDVEQYNIIITEWFEIKEQFKEIIEESDIYFAPRVVEGIGHSFLEAMALGKCVVAPDCPTVNEYICHGENGILYDINRLKPLDLSDWKNIGEKAARSTMDGHKEWTQKSCPFILDFIVDKDEMEEYSLSISKWGYGLLLLFFSSRFWMKKNIPILYNFVSLCYDFNLCVFKFFYKKLLKK